MQIRRLGALSGSRAPTAAFDCPAGLVELLALRQSWGIDVLPSVPPLAFEPTGDLTALGGLTTSGCPVPASTFGEQWNRWARWRAARADRAGGPGGEPDPSQDPPPSWRADVGLEGVAADALRDFVNAVRRRFTDRLREHVATTGRDASVLPGHGARDGETVDVLPLSAAFEVQVSPRYRITDADRWMGASRRP